ncbi:MAG: HAD family hydrolase [Planctomycetota bacterium]|nr:HAD family hydrolase [Planctomycetota bacterium]
MKYGAVLFDLDGTLLDTIADLTEAMNDAMATLGHPPRTVEECKIFVGDGVVNFARRALPTEHNDDQTVGRCVKQMRVEYGKRWAQKTRPYPGIGQLLTELERRGVAMAVLSNKPQEFTELMVARLLGDWTFRAVHGARPDVAIKPDPGSALDIAREMGIEPREFLYVGDTDTDMQTAVGAGMFPVGALWGFRPGEELTRHGAKVLISTPGELLGLL